MMNIITSCGLRSVDNMRTRTAVHIPLKRCIRPSILDERITCFFQPALEHVLESLGKMRCMLSVNVFNALVMRSMTSRTLTARQELTFRPFNADRPFARSDSVEKRSS